MKSKFYPFLFMQCCEGCCYCLLRTVVKWYRMIVLVKNESTCDTRIRYNNCKLCELECRIRM